MGNSYHRAVDPRRARYHRTKSGKALTDYVHRIAYTSTFRGVNDDIPTLLFLGAPFALLQDVCTPLCRWMDGAVADITIQREHSCRRKNGKHYWRIAVGIIGLDEYVISYDEFVKLIVNKIKTTANCTVRHYQLETFLNL